MSVTQIASAAPEPEGHSHQQVEPARPQGIYALPVVGPKFQQARDVTDGLRPTDDDSFPHVVAKRTAQASVILATTAVAALVVL